MNRSFYIFFVKDIAIHGEFTVAEAMQFFGRALQMKKSEVEHRTEFLLDFLDLPKSNTLVRQLR
jgi:ABC-type multidrug transport system ATPase subunit